MSLLEILIALAVSVIALGGFVRSLASSQEASEHDRQLGLASEAGRQAMERLKGAAFDAVYSMYNADASDDGGGAVPGPAFDVDGLDPLPDDADGAVGRVAFPEMLVGGDWMLREDTVDPRIGMPRDLNADGVIDAVDHSDDYRLLPVLVRVEWMSGSGPCRVEFKTVLNPVF